MAADLTRCTPTKVHRVKSDHPFATHEEQEAQLMLKTGSTRLAVNQGQHSTIPYVTYNLSLRRAVFTIFDFKKCHDLEMGVKGHSRSLRVVSFDRLRMVS